MFDSNKTDTTFQPKAVQHLVIQQQQAAGVRGDQVRTPARIHNPSYSVRSAPLASSMPAAPAPHLVDVLLEAVSDRQACTWWASCCSGRRRHRCAAATRCARGQDPQPELQRAIGAAGQQRPGRAGAAPGRRPT